ncbi:MAG: electron transfer flavoprotein subunit beta/FixA family protein [Pseudomonadales bacterium]
MHIVVCAKYIPDPEFSSIAFEINPDTLRRAEVPGLKKVMSPYDEQCFEVALQVREQLGDDIRITVLCLGDEDDAKIFKTAFSLGADQGIFLNDPVLAGADGYITAMALSAAIRKLGDVNLVLTGRMAADYDEGIVGYGIAELLGWPVLPCAGSVSVGESSVNVERIRANGHDVIEAALPAVVTVSNEVGEPRRPTMRQIMQAGRMKPEEWCVDDLQLNENELDVQGARLVVEDVFVPTVERHCDFIQAATAADTAAQLVELLRTMKVGK